MCFHSKHIGILESSLRIGQGGTPQSKCCPNRGVPLPRPTRWAHQRRPVKTLSITPGVLLKGHENLLPYIDINPHKTGPKWPAYLGFAVLVAATIAIVTLALTSH